MLGLVLTALFCAACALAFYPLLARVSELDEAERWGLSGLFGLGAAGTLLFVLGLLPGGLHWGAWLVLVAVAFGSSLAIRSLLGNRRSASPGSPGPYSAFSVLLLGALGLAVATIGALAPATTMEWDSLAYHLAVPKLWLEAGQMYWVRGIHHSTFPFVVDMLYVLGLCWGGEVGAKAFSPAYLVFGMLAVGGMARRWYGPKALIWACAAFLGVPVVLWQSGTAYIDLANGLYSGLGMALVLDGVLRKLGHHLWLGAALLGLGAASKITGLQVVFAVCVVLVLHGAFTRTPAHALRSIGIISLAVLVISGGWYVRTLAWTGNPVYPFFSSVFPTADWDEWRAAIYRDEQQSFGVGRTEQGRDLAQFGHAVLGLAYQPGRYVNPGQGEGLGFPTGSIGFAGLLAGVLWLSSGRAGAREKSVLAVLFVLFVLWFFLSQQSRYITYIATPLCLLAGGLAASGGIGAAMRLVLGLQVGYTFWMTNRSVTLDQLPVALGTVDREVWRAQRTAFSEAAAAINADDRVGKVALYEEVFGFLLERPYFWANPGHSTKIPHETLETGPDYARTMRELGFTHIYKGIGGRFDVADAPGLFDRWAGSMGLGGGGILRPTDREAMMRDPNLRWRWLLADALRSGEVRREQSFRRGVLLRL